MTVYSYGWHDIRNGKIWFDYFRVPYIDYAEPLYDCNKLAVDIIDMQKGTQQMQILRCGYPYVLF